MTYTPFQEDPSIQSFQEQTGFSPLENDFGGDEVLRALQQTEQRRDLFDESRRAQQELQRTNRKINDENFKIEQLEPLRKLSDFSQTVGDYFIKRDQEFVKKRIAEEEIKVASGIYDSVFDPKKAETQPTLTPEQQQQNQELEARGEANFEAQTAAAATGNFDAVKLIQAQRPDVQLGLVKALLNRAKLTYGAEAEAELLQRFPEGATDSLTREKQLAQIRNEKLAPITQLLSPAVIADSKILEEVAKEDAKILTRTITNDRITYGNNQVEALEGQLARNELTPEQFVQQYSVLPDATGKRARGLGTAYQALETYYSKTPLNGDRLKALQESTLMQERPGMYDRILIAQDRLSDEVQRRDDNNQFKAAQQELGQIEEQIRRGEAYPSQEQIDKLRIKYASNPVVYGRLQQQFTRLDGLTREEQAKNATTEQKDQSKRELDRAAKLGILTKDMIDNSALDVTERQFWYQQLNAQGNASGNRTAADGVRSEVRDLLKNGILKGSGDTQTGGLVNGIMADYAMAKYAEIRSDLIQGGMDPAKANLEAKKQLFKWLEEEGALIKGQQTTEGTGLFTKNPQTGEWRILEQGQNQSNRALKVGQATRQFIDSQSGDEWYKQRAVVSSMPGGYTQFSSTQGTVLSLSEVRQIVKDVQDGKQITIPPSVTYAARVKGISPLTIINGQIEAFQEVDSSLETIDSTVGTSLENIKAIDPQKWAELTRFQSPNRSARGLGGSAMRGASQGTGGPVDFKPENIPMVDGQNVSQVVEQSATSNGQNPALMSGLFDVENGWQSKGCSSAGACGIGQFMPDTAAQYGLDVYNVNQSIETTGRYLADIGSYLKTTDERLIYTAYNWGMGNVGKLIDKLGEQGASQYLKDLADGKIKSRRDLYVPQEAIEYFWKVNKASYKYGNNGALRSSATMRPTFSQLTA